MIYVASIIILGAHAFTLFTIAEWFNGPISMQQAIWFSIIVRVLNVARYRKGSLEAWPDALGQTGVGCAVVLVVAFVIKSLIF